MHQVHQTSQLTGLFYRTLFVLSVSFAYHQQVIVLLLVNLKHSMLK